MIVAVRLAAFAVVAAAAILQALLLESFREDVVRGVSGPIDGAPPQAEVMTSVWLAGAIVIASGFLLVSSMRMRRQR